MNRRTFILSLSLSVGLLALRGSAVVAQQIDREYDLKAAYLYNFGKFVDWPKNAIPGNDDTFVIGVIGRDPFGRILDAIAQAKTIQDKKIVIRRFASAKDYQPCHILFVAAEADDGADEKTVEDRMKAATAKTKGAPVLLVGDTPGLAQKGALISFFIDDNKVKLEINSSAATGAGLKISSNLLKLSVVKIVSGS
jgi:YfiR/HmsC-like